jgi:hypothetical protein
VIPADPVRCHYSGDPSESPLDAARFWCQDTDPSFWILPDEEYEYLIDFISANTTDDPLWIASVCCTIIASKFTREVSVSADGVSVDVGALQQKYLTLAASLRDQYDETHGDLVLPSNSYPYGSYVPDTSVPPLIFGIGMSDNFEAGLQDYGWRRYYPGYLPSGGSGSQLEDW